MKNYLDLLDINNYPLNVCLQLRAITNNGIPRISVAINNDICYQGCLENSVVISKKINLLDSVCIQLSMSDKIYSQNQETALIVKNINIDGYELTEYYNDCVPYISYLNDQNVDHRGFYLGFNGVWQFELDRPFYQWWHTVSGQGWLLEPAPIKLI